MLFAGLLPFRFFWPLSADGSEWTRKRVPRILWIAPFFWIVLCKLALDWRSYQIFFLVGSSDLERSEQRSRATHHHWNLRQKRLSANLPSLFGSFLKVSRKVTYTTRASRFLFSISFLSFFWIPFLLFFHSFRTFQGRLGSARQQPRSAEAN